MKPDHPRLRPLGHGLHLAAVHEHVEQPRPRGKTQPHAAGSREQVEAGDAPQPAGIVESDMHPRQQHSARCGTGGRQGGLRQLDRRRLHGGQSRRHQFILGCRSVRRHLDRVADAPGGIIRLPPLDRQRGTAGDRSRRSGSGPRRSAAVVRLASTSSLNLPARGRCKTIARPSSPGCHSMSSGPLPAAPPSSTSSSKTATRVTLKPRNVDEGR